MRATIETCLNSMGDYLWSQFEKDLEMSYKVSDQIHKILSVIHGFFYPQK